MPIILLSRLVYFHHLRQEQYKKEKVRYFHLVLFLMDNNSNDFEEIDEADVQILILLVLGLSTMTAYFRLLVAVLRLLQNH